MGGLLLTLFFLCLSACTVTPTGQETRKTLVSAEDPVFDRRFQDLSFKDLDLRNLWIEGSVLQGRAPIPLTNLTLAQVAEQAKAGIVNIYTRTIEEHEAKLGVSPNDLLPIRIPMLSDLFDIIPFKVPIPFRAEGVSLGSGFVIHPQGYILTNAHVIHNATDIRVVLFGGRNEYAARIIGKDLLTDSALIKVEPEAPLQAIPLGDSDGLQIGEMVLAIGNPLGLTHTVTSGIVSAKERIAPDLNDKLLDFLQTDSAINPGSSGGPLMNLYGEVVGINTAVMSHAQSIGFAVPINTVKEVMPMLVLGKTERGWLGIRVAPLALQKASELGYKGKGSLLVLEVEPGSPAERADIRQDDILETVNGRAYDGFLLFRRSLLGLTPGQEIRLGMVRGGTPREISVTLEHKKEKEAMPGGPGPSSRGK